MRRAVGSHFHLCLFLCEFSVTILIVLQLPKSNKLLRGGRDDAEQHKED
jgi:hypothetical protein